jgi:hypothetical protein
MADPTLVNDQITDAAALADGQSTVTSTPAPMTVNSQITDAVAQTSLSVLGNAAAQALGSLYQASAQSLGLSMQNAVTQQQSMNAIAQAVTTQAIAALLATAPEK